MTEPQNELSDQPVTRDLWRVGDIVTRDGSDEHQILAISECRDLVTVKCVKEPDDKWTEIGEVEDNLTRRYSWVRSGETKID